MQSKHLVTLSDLRLVKISDLGLINHKQIVHKLIVIIYLLFLLHSVFHARRNIVGVILAKFARKPAMLFHLVQN
jgi:predicted ferric reductase